jgi:DNA helicase-2/ATP-dependent DNA helicase PcrA
MGGYGVSRFDNMEPFNSAYRTPGWQRAQANRGQSGKNGADPRKRTEREPTTIEGELIARSVIGGTARFSTGDRVFHQKFGPGTVAAVDGNKLTVDFDKAGQKRVVDSFVEAA